MLEFSLSCQSLRLPQDPIQLPQTCFLGEEKTGTKKSPLWPPDRPLDHWPVQSSPQGFTVFEELCATISAADLLMYIFMHHSLIKPGDDRQDGYTAETRPSRAYRGDTRIIMDSDTQTGPIPCYHMQCFLQKSGNQEAGWG